VRLSVIGAADGNEVACYPPSQQDRPGRNGKPRFSQSRKLGAKVLKSSRSRLPNPIRTTGHSSASEEAAVVTLSAFRRNP
jgi:hypothetical protein